MKKIDYKKATLARFQKYLIATLLLSFLFVTLHSAVHSGFEHTHDSSCGVYVLEELYFAGDTIGTAVAFSLFTPYLFLLFATLYISAKVEKTFAIRAPPSF